MIIEQTIQNYDLIIIKVQVRFDMRVSTNSLPLNSTAVQYSEDISAQSFNTKVDKKGRVKAWLGILYFMVLMVSVIFIFVK